MKFQFALHGWRAAVVIVATFFSSSAWAAAVAPEVSVRLRPLKGAITVSGNGLVIRSDAVDEGGAMRSVVVAEARRFERFVVRFSRANGVGSWSVTDTAGAKPKQIPTRKIEITGEDIRVDLRPAPPHLQLVGQTRGENADLVGLMSLESYLEGVVAGEVPREWPMEALKAQAVAARSFTVAKAFERRSLSADWLFEASVQDQVFDHARVNPRATEAVRATQGEVLVSVDRVIATHYHSDCGGQTDEPGTVWGGSPEKNGTAKDTFCSLKGRSSWRYVSDLTDLTKRLFSRGLIPEKFKLAAMSIGRRSSGGRALEIKARSADGQERVFSGERLRAALGYSDLRSTLFNVTVTDTSPGSGRVEFVGRGFGHGAGLCQWGSRQQALSGRTYREILAHYYPRLRLHSGGLSDLKTRPTSVAVLRPGGVTLGANASP